MLWQRKFLTGKFVIRRESVGALFSLQGLFQFSISLENLLNGQKREAESASAFAVE